MRGHYKPLAWELSETQRLAQIGAIGTAQLTLSWKAWVALRKGEKPACRDAVEKLRHKPAHSRELLATQAATALLTRLAFSASASNSLSA